MVMKDPGQVGTKCDDPIDPRRPLPTLESDLQMSGEGYTQYSPCIVQSNQTNSSATRPLLGRPEAKWDLLRLRYLA